MFHSRACDIQEQAQHTYLSSIYYMIYIFQKTASNIQEQPAEFTTFHSRINWTALTKEVVQLRGNPSYENYRYFHVYRDELRHIYRCAADVCRHLRADAQLLFSDDR